MGDTSRLDRLLANKESINKKVYRCFENVDKYYSIDVTPVERLEIEKELIKDTEMLLSISFTIMQKTNNRGDMPIIVGSTQENEILFAHILILMNRIVSIKRIPAAMAITSKDGVELSLEVNPLFLFGGLLDRIENDNNFTDRDILVSLDSNQTRASSFYLAQIVSVLCHEAFHVLYEHISMYKREYNKGKHNAELLNYATDTIINEQLNNIPSSTYNHQSMVKLLEDETLEVSTSSMYYYRKLIEKFPRREDFPQPNQPSPDDIKDMLDKLEDMSDEQKENFKDIVKNNVDYHGGWDGTEDDNDLESNMMTDLVKETLTQAVDNYEEQKSLDKNSRGTLSGDVHEIVTLLKEKTKMNWLQILRLKIGTLAIPFKLTKTRVNRRQPFRPNLRGKIYDRIIKVTFAFDTSGSMSKQDIEYCLQEVFTILSDYKFEITIVEFDATVNKVYKIKNPNNIDINISGRGGTSFQPVFDWVMQQRMKNNEDILIIATDGGGEHTVTHHGFTNVMWLLINERYNLSVQNTIGEVFKLNEDKKYRKVMRENSRS